MRGPSWWTQLSKGYLTRLRVRGRQPTTIKNNAAVHALFGTYLLATNVHTGGDLTGDLVVDFLDHLDVSAGSRAAYTNVIRSTLKWGSLHDFDIDAKIPLAIEPVRRPRRRPRPIPDSEADRIREWARTTPSSIEQLRDRALFLTLYATGARISEVIQLDRDSFVDRTAFVTEKGGGEKMIVITEQAERAIRDYLSRRTDDSAALFVTHARQLTGNRLTARSANYAWRRLCLQLGLHRFTNHRIRHTTGTDLVNKEVPLEVVIDVLGHHDATTIMNYVAVSKQRRRRALELLEDGADPERPILLPRLKRRPRRARERGGARRPALGDRGG